MFASNCGGLIWFTSSLPSLPASLSSCPPPTSSPFLSSGSSLGQVVGGCFQIKSMFRNGQLPEADNSATWGGREAAENGQCRGGMLASFSHVQKSQCTTGTSTSGCTLFSITVHWKTFACLGQTGFTALLLPCSLFLHQTSPQPKNPLHGCSADLPGPLLPVRHSLHYNEVSQVTSTPGCPQYIHM